MNLRTRACHRLIFFLLDEYDGVPGCMDSCTFLRCYRISYTDKNINSHSRMSVIVPVCIRCCSRHFATQSSHFVDRGGWRAKTASIEFWIPWHNAHGPHYSLTRYQPSSHKRVVIGPVRIRHSSHHFGWQSSHSVDLAGWQAKMASIEIWIPWRNAHKPHCRIQLGTVKIDRPVSLIEVHQ